MQKGIPAVAAIQSRITAGAVRYFSEALYTTLLQGLPIDVAVNRGRAAIPRQAEKQQICCEFGVPLLFLRTAEEKLFTLPDQTHETLSLLKNMAINMCREHGFDSIKAAAIHFASNAKELMKYFRT